MKDNEVMIDIAWKSLVAGISDRNPDEWHHCRRVERTCALLARELGWEPQAIADLKLAALLHHLDRSHVPEAALSPSVAECLHRFAETNRRLETDTRRTMTHADEACEIIAVADAYDRLTSSQRYRKPISDDDALRVMCHDAGTTYSPAVVEALRRVHDSAAKTSESKAA